MRSFLLALALAVLCAAPQAAQARPDRLVIHVNDGDSRKLGQALAFANNVSGALQGRSSARVVILATGDAIDMFLETESLFGPSLRRLRRTHNVRLVACGNSLKGRAAAERVSVEDLILLPGVDRVQVGVMELMRLQDNGYAYVRP